jgi:hypothetical protein
MSSEHSKEVIGDYEKLFENDEGCDVIIYAGKDSKELHAHSIILRTRLQCFRTAFAKKKNGKFILVKSNITPSIFKIILR